jgi:hypothetical protein
MYPVPPVMKTSAGELFMRASIYHLCVEYAILPRSDSWFEQSDRDFRMPFSPRLTKAIRYNPRRSNSDF